MAPTFGSKRLLSRSRSERGRNAPAGFMSAGFILAKALLMNCGPLSLRVQATSDKPQLPAAAVLKNIPHSSRWPCR
jgi:hypothetical protein